MAETAPSAPSGRSARRERAEKLAALGAKPWRPQPSQEVLPVFRVRDLAMQPERGAQREMRWMHFVGSVQLRLPLVGDRWEGVLEDDFEVRVCENELSVRCVSQDAAEYLESLNGTLKREVDPKRCWFALERDVGDPAGKQRVLVIELAKKTPGKAWAGEQIFQETLFKRQSFAWQANQVLLKKDGDGWVVLKPGRRSDVEDPFTVSRGWLCAELEQGQTHELVQWRIVLDQKKLDEALEKVPFFSVFGADCSRRFFKLFIRGDEASPILLGELGGAVVPEQTVLELTTFTREVPGHRIAGTMETLPCLDVTLAKAQDSLGQWEELLHADEGVLNQPQGSLEEYEEQQLKAQRDPDPSREDWTPDDWADEQKELADAAFKEGCYRDAIVYYTRALRHTPLNEKLLSNRSAAYLKILRYQLALEDAEKALQIEPRWSKVYFRKGQALRGLRRFEDSIAAFREGVALDRSNPEWEREVQRTKDAEAAFEAKKAQGAR